MRDRVSLNDDKIHSRVAGRTLSSFSYREFKHSMKFDTFSRPQKVKFCVFSAFLCHSFDRRRSSGGLDIGHLAKI